MDLKWNYGQGVLVLPASVLSADASAEQLRVLLWLASDPTLAEKPAQLAKLADTDRTTLSEALQFWKENGILTDGDGSAEVAPTTSPTPTKKQTERQEKNAPVRKTLRRADELPTYNSEQLAEMLEKRASLRVLLDACQNIFGKMFNPQEINILFGMVDFLKLDDEYILILLAHCTRLEFRSFRQIERYAISLLDMGVTTAEALEERLQEMEAAHKLEGHVRSLFGLKSRALTAKEKKALEQWVAFGYGEEILRLAYDITVNSIGSPSIPYANSILERWHSEGMKTAEEIQARIAEEQAEKQSQVAFGNSFQTDDFLEAAIRSSLRKSREQNQTNADQG